MICIGDMYLAWGGREWRGKKEKEREARGELVFLPLSLDDMEHETSPGGGEGGRGGWESGRTEEELCKEEKKNPEETITEHVNTVAKMQTQNTPPCPLFSLWTLCWNPWTVVGYLATAILSKLCQRDGERKPHMIKVALLIAVISQDVCVFHGMSVVTISTHQTYHLHRPEGNASCWRKRMSLQDAYFLLWATWSSWRGQNQAMLFVAVHLEISKTWSQIYCFMRRNKSKSYKPVSG